MKCAEGAGEADSFVGADEEGAEGLWGGGHVNVARGGVDAVDEVVEGVEGFGGEDAAVVLLLGWLLLLLGGGGGGHHGGVVLFLWGFG